MMMEMVRNGIIPAIIVLMFGLEIAHRKYKDEDVTVSLYFYMLFFYLTIVDKGITGHLYSLFIIALVYSVCIQVLCSVFSKKQQKIN